MSESANLTVTLPDTGIPLPVEHSTGGPPGYEMLEEVGRGGMGIVYRARDLAFDREVAVKLLQDKFAPNSLTATRFLEEARITGQLQHPGIPAAYQVGVLADGRPFLAMKLIKGQTLDQLVVARTPVDPLAIFEAISQAVGYAHAHGVIHRDLKPQNIMVGAFGEVQVMDWGLAKLLSRSCSEPRSNEADPEVTIVHSEIKSGRELETPLTQYGSVLGTPAYMAPEQAAGDLDKVDTRADVFGLGAILCVLLTGRPPYLGDDALSVRLLAMRGNTEESFVRLEASGADPDVVALCKRCLAFEPSDRPVNGNAAAAVVASLRRAADDRAKQAEIDRVRAEGAKVAAETTAAEQSKRRRAVQWATGLIALVLLVGFAGTTIGLIQAMIARGDAEAAERAAEEKRIEAVTARLAEQEQTRVAKAKAAEANAVVKFLEDRVFAAARPKGRAGGLGKDVTLRDAIAACLAALSQEFADQPLVEARLRHTVGNTFWYLREPRMATPHLERALAIYRERLGADDPLALEVQSDLANSYYDLNRHTEALAMRIESLANRKRVLPPDDPAILVSMINLAFSYAVLNRYAEALVLQQEALRKCRQIHGPVNLDTLQSMWGAVESLINTTARVWFLSMP